jgi:hypothetical protein
MKKSGWTRPQKIHVSSLVRQEQQCVDPWPSPSICALSPVHQKPRVDRGHLPRSRIWCTTRCEIIIETVGLAVSKRLHPRSRRRITRASGHAVPKRLNTHSWRHIIGVSGHAVPGKCSRTPESDAASRRRSASRSAPDPIPISASCSPKRPPELNLALFGLIFFL